MNIELTLQLLSLLFLVAILAGFIDAIAGGGGLITIPALMWVGLPPTAALATNKLQACGGSFSASVYFVRKGMVNLSTMRLPIACAFVGSALGTVAVQQIDTQMLKVILPFLTVAIALYFLFAKRVSEQDKQQLIAPTLFAFTAAFGVGLYDGFFGPGTGSFFALAYVVLAGFGLAKATAHAKLLNFSTNIASLLFFAIGGKVLWSIGLLMLMGQTIGATLGAKLVVRKGSSIVRPIVVMVSMLMSVKLLFDQYHIYWS